MTEIINVEAAKLAENNETTECLIQVIFQLFSVALQPSAGYGLLVHAVS
jgi:hypothetical protein